MRLWEKWQPPRLAPLLGRGIGGFSSGGDAAPCFVENIADAPRYAGSKPYLTGEALHFFAYWERA